VSVLFVNVMLALTWAFLTGSLTSDTLVEGFIIGYLVLWLASPLYGPTVYFRKVRQAISFVLFFLRELLVATFRVARVVIDPNLNIRPAIVAVPLDLTNEFQITLLANLVTLTPGSLTLDVSDDRQVMYVHAMYAEDLEQYRQEIKQGFERRIGELFGDRESAHRFSKSGDTLHAGTLD